MEVSRVEVDLGMEDEKDADRQRETNKLKTPIKKIEHKTKNHHNNNK